MRYITFPFVGLILGVLFGSMLGAGENHYKNKTERQLTGGLSIGLFGMMGGIGGVVGGIWLAGVWYEERRNEKAQQERMIVLRAEQAEKERREKAAISSLGLNHDAEMERVHFLMANLAFMKNKSARDYLMGTGMNQNTLAIDVRLRNIFSSLRMELPDAGKLTSRKAYRSLEMVLIQKVCLPLSLAPVVLDRILYQDYTRIMKKEYRQWRLF